MELGRFPDFDSLRRITVASKVDVNVGYLLQRVNRFFQDDVHDLHTAIPTQVALSESATIIEPRQIMTRNMADVQPLFAEALICLALDKSRKDAFAREARIVTRPFEPEHRSILVRAENVEVEPPNTHELRIENMFSAVFTPRDLVDFRYESLLEGGGSSFVTAVRELVAETFPGVTAPEFSVGRHFWRSLETTAMIEDRFVVEKALKICAAIVAGRHDDLDLRRRPVRKTRAADSDQVTRSSDKAKAWRITITLHGAGYRLQYWATPRTDKTPERIDFANVARERDPVDPPEE